MKTKKKVRKYYYDEYDVMQKIKKYFKVGLYEKDEFWTSSEIVKYIQDREDNFDVSSVAVGRILSYMGYSKGVSHQKRGWIVRRNH